MRISDWSSDVCSSDLLEKRVRPLANEVGSDFLIECDVADMAEMDRAFDTLAARWPTIDFVLHAIGFSDKNELRGKYVDTGLDNFTLTINVSDYRFVTVLKRPRRMMPHCGSLLTLPYSGAEKGGPHDKV